MKKGQKIKKENLEELYKLIPEREEMLKFQVEVLSSESGYYLVKNHGTYDIIPDPSGLEIVETSNLEEDIKSL